MGNGFVHHPMGTRPWGGSTVWLCPCQGIHSLRTAPSQGFLCPYMCCVLPKSQHSSRPVAQVFQMLLMSGFPGPSLSWPLCEGIFWWWLPSLKHIVWRSKAYLHWLYLWLEYTRSTSYPITTAQAKPRDQDWISSSSRGWSRRIKSLSSSWQFSESLHQNKTQNQPRNLVPCQHACLSSESQYQKLNKTTNKNKVSISGRSITLGQFGRRSSGIPGFVWVTAKSSVPGPTVEPFELETSPSKSSEIPKTHTVDLCPPWCDG